MSHRPIRRSGVVSRLLPLAIFVAASRGVTAQPRSAWVFPGPDGRLTYHTTEAGDRIMDFSHAGYRGGGVALPEVATVETVHPVAGADATAAIQAAVDRVAARPLRDGFRGAVLLGPGTFACAGTITIPASGVVLRGSGSGAGDGPGPVSTLRMTGTPHLAIAVRAAEVETAGLGRDPAAARTSVSDAYVPAGASAFNVADATGFAAGDAIAIHRPVTEAWIHFMQMDDMTRDGRPQTWIKPGSVVTIERRIAAIDGRRLTLDVPLPDSFDARLLDPPGTLVEKIAPTARVTEVGIESLHIESPAQEISHHEAHFAAVRLHGEDCWMRDVVIDETMNSVGTTGRRITLERVAVRRRARHQGASRPMEFAPDAGQVLLDRCTVIGDNIWFVGTGARVAGPIVVLNGVFLGQGRAESHQRWSTGILYDNCLVPDGGIEMRNRGSMGSGHGWTMGWGVAWNCAAREYLVQNPPGARNWLIGGMGVARTSPRPFGTGPELPGGTVDALGSIVEPRSLYLAQLAERLGPEALRRIGYATSDPASAIVRNPAASLAAGHGVATNVAAAGQADGVRPGNLALDRPVLATNVRGGRREFGAWLAVDDDPATYWATDDGAAGARLELDTEGPVEIDTIELVEPAGLAGHVRAWKAEGFTGDVWCLLASGTAIGGRLVHQFPATTIWKLRLTLIECDGPGGIGHLGIYRNPGPRVSRSD